MSFSGWRKSNKVKILGDQAAIMSTNNLVILVDTADLPSLKPWTWTVRINPKRPSNRYAATYVYNPETGRNKMLFMTQCLLGVQTEGVIDHIDRNTLDNRRSNLRICTHLQNSQNRKAAQDGVQFREHCKKNPWRARIRVNKKLIQIGHYPTRDEAIEARRAAQLKYFGEFAPRR